MDIFNILSCILSGTAIAMLIAAWVLCIVIAKTYGIKGFNKSKKAIAFPIALAAFSALDISMYVILLIENIVLGCIIVYLVNELKTAKELVAQANAPKKAAPVVIAAAAQQPKVEQKDFIERTASEEDIALLNQRKKSDISIEEARNAISDSVAARFVEKKRSEVTRFQKKSIVNIDTLSQNFQSGDTVNLATLTEKRLVPKGTDYVKVLGRGHLDKKLFVEVNDFSADAIKMIILTDGTVTKIF